MRALRGAVLDHEPEHIGEIEQAEYEDAIRASLTQAELWAEQLRGQARVTESYAPPVARTVRFPGDVTMEIEALSQNTGSSLNEVTVRLVRIGLESLSCALDREERDRLFTLRSKESFERSQADE